MFVISMFYFDHQVRCCFYRRYDLPITTFGNFDVSVSYPIFATSRKQKRRWGWGGGHCLLITGPRSIIFARSSLSAFAASRKIFSCPRSESQMPFLEVGSLIFCLSNAKSQRLWVPLIKYCWYKHLNSLSLKYPTNWTKAFYLEKSQAEAHTEKHKSR